MQLLYMLLSVTMNNTIKQQLIESIGVKQRAIETLVDPISEAASLFIETLRSGHVIFLAGNGGSAADAQHIAGELVGRFLKERKAFPAVSLATDTSILTALANDYGVEKMFSRQLEALGKDGDLFVAISTSGNSKNILSAVMQAKSIGMRTIALTGNDGGKLKEMVDLAVVAPSESTPRIQELHITIGHIICGLAENTLLE